MSRPIIKIKNYIFLSIYFLGFILLSACGISKTSTTNPPHTSDNTATILSYSLGSIRGIISNQNIVVTMPYGTDDTALVPTFSISRGSSVVANINGQQVPQQPDGSSGSINFSSPVTYTVTSTDGTIANKYIVTVKNTLNPAKAISTYSLLANDGKTLIPGQISGQNITVTMPSSTTNLTQLVATFTTNPANETVLVGTQTQQSGITSNDFTQNKGVVIYTVTAADGSIVNYNVTVSAAKITDAKISDYSLADNSGHLVLGTISGLNIAVSMPTGTNTSALVATFNYLGASIVVGSTAQISTVTPNEFPTDGTGIIYKVTAADGTTIANYTVTVSVAKKKDAKISDYSLADNSGHLVLGTISGLNIAVSMPNGTNTSALVATFNYLGASIVVGSTAQISTVTPNKFPTDGTGIIYKVTAADGTTIANYTVIVSIQPPPTQTVTSSISINNKPASKVKIKQGAIVPITLIFKTNFGTVSNLRVTLTNPKDPNFSLINSSCNTVDTSENCKITLKTIPATMNGNGDLRDYIYFTYNDGINHNSLNNFLYEIEKNLNQSISINQGEINSLTKKSNKLIINAESGVLNSGPSLTTINLSGFVISTIYPSQSGNNFLRYSNPLINGDDIIVKEALQQENTSNPFWFYLNTNQNAANTQYMGSQSYSYSNSTAFLSGFKTAPVLAADNESYYMIGVDRQFPITTPSDLLYPTIMNITAQGVPTTNLKQLDPISNNDDNAPPAAPLIIQNSLLYFKSNYSLIPPTDISTSPTPEIFILNSNPISIKKRIPIASTQSNLIVTNKYLFSGDDAGLIHAYDLNGTEYSNAFSSISSCINQLILSYDENTIYILSDKGIYSADITNVKTDSNINPKGSDLSFSKKSRSNKILLSTSQKILYVANESSIYAISTDNLTQIWNSSFYSISGKLTSITLADDNGTIYAGNNGGTIYSIPTTIDSDFFVIITP